MIKRTAGFLLVLLLSGCSLLPIETLSPTPTCPNGACETATLKPTTLVLTPTEIATQKPATAVPTLLDTPGESTPTPDTFESETPYLPTGIAELTSTATLTPGTGPTSTRTPVVSDKYYILQEGTPRLIENFTKPNDGCKWMGAAGQVFGAGGIPMKNMVVVITGELNGELIDAVGLTGLDSAYGSGGYEIQIANRTMASNGELFVQLFDLNGMELSIPYPIDTSDACTENLVIINFVPNL
jgi:hypothetical protein